MIYVIDGPAILSVAAAASDPAATFLAMTALVADGSLSFPSEVVSELERLARNEESLLWAKSSAPNCNHKGAAYNCFEYVAHAFPSLIDISARNTQEPACLYVVALALELREAKQQVCVVSEDQMPKPTRATVHEACKHFHLRCVTLQTFFEETGLVEADGTEDEHK